MSFYLVSASPRGELIDDLHDCLARAEFWPLRPFGQALSHGLENARRAPDGGAVWEEEDYCSPPLAEERAAVLDRYFDGLAVEEVARGEGWRRIADLPALFPDLAGRGGRGVAMAVEEQVARHYGTGGLLDRIRAGLRQAGVDPDCFRPADLKPVDEFHIGGAAATEALLEQAPLRADMAVLDIGCGIGGTARLIAERTGARVTGIDLTDEFVETARALSGIVGLEGRTEFRAGSALSIPCEDGSFDAALLLHVGMNISDKRALMVEAARVLRPGALFLIYEVMRTGEGDLAFPVPWAAAPETSFVATPDEYRAAALAAGFEVVHQRERRGFALDFFARMQARMAESGPPPLGIHLFMGQTAREKIANMVANIEAGRIAPVEMILRAPA